MSSDTIYALASGRGKAGIAVIRVSGPRAKMAGIALTGSEPTVRRAQRIELRDPKTKEVLDQGLGLFFPGPASFTGEDVLELQVHGGFAVIEGVFGALNGIDGLRMAEPGEFTRRGFENGKIDLTGAEGLLDLIEAETAAQRRQALRQIGGALASFCDQGRARLIDACAHWEAAIDFSDEDLPQDLEQSVSARVEELARDLEEVMADSGRGERLRHGVEIAIVGPPNAGKSSLLNRLARRDAAIVSETAGTTRDVIEVHFEIAGYPAIFADTAGLRIAGDEIEREGVRRAKDRAAQADLRLVVLDGEEWPEVDAETAAIHSDRTVSVINKIDAMTRPVPATWQDRPLVGVSAKTGAGIDELLGVLEVQIADRFDSGPAPIVTRARHRQALLETLEALQRFLTSSNRMARPELAAEDLRLAARALGRVTGSVDVEDLLDVIFADFCIGK